MLNIVRLIYDDNFIMDKKAKLVADDRVDIEKKGDKLIGKAPLILYKKLEIRNVGICVCDDQ